MCDASDASEKEKEKIKFKFNQDELFLRRKYGSLIHTKSQSE